MTSDQKFDNAASDSENLNSEKIDNESVEASQDTEYSDKGDVSASRRAERILAFNLLYALDRFDYSVGIDYLIENFASGFDLPIEKMGFAITLVEGAAESRADIDEQIKPFLKGWKIERIGCCTHLVLRLAIWELMQKDPVPAVVINEAVELAKTFAEKDSYKFVNGVLDQYCRAKFGSIDKKSV